MTILEEARETIQAINANLSAAPSASKPGARYGRVNPETGQVEWTERSRIVQHRSGYPFFSLNLSVSPRDIQAAEAMLRANGVPGVEFNAQGCPKIESTAQHRKIAKALGLFDGRDGYGHKGEDGRHENSGERRGDELETGRRKTDNLVKELSVMPDDASEEAVERVVKKHTGT